LALALFFDAPCFDGIEILDTEIPIDEKILEELKKI
jgi:hypothetical protein